jgi:hypothetical protein
MRSLPSARIVVVFAGYVVGGFALARGFPEPVPPFWLGAPMVAFLLPTATAITDFLLRGLCVNHPIEESSSPSVLAIYDAIMLRFTLFIFGVHLAIQLAVSGLLSRSTWAAELVPLMLGFTLISIGNLLPKTRPNLAIGIRTQRTLSDGALWMRVHRRVGYIAVGCGIVIVLSAIAVPRPVGPGMILLVGPAGLAGTYLLVRCSRKHVRA